MKSNSIIQDEELTKRFNCTKCTVNLMDIKLKMLKFWKVVISEQEMLAAKSILEKQPIKTSSLPVSMHQNQSTAKPNLNKSTARKKSLVLINQKKNKRNKIKISEKGNIDEEDDDIYKRDTFNLSQTENIFDKLDRLTDEEIIYFNFTQTDDLEMRKIYKKSIDETILLAKYKQIKQNKDESGKFISHLIFDFIYLFI